MPMCSIRVRSSGLGFVSIHVEGRAKSLHRHRYSRPVQPEALLSTMKRSPPQALIMYETVLCRYDRPGGSRFRWVARCCRGLLHGCLPVRGEGRGTGGRQVRQEAV